MFVFPRERRGLPQPDVVLHFLWHTCLFMCVYPPCCFLLSFGFLASRCLIGALFCVPVNVTSLTPFLRCPLCFCVYSPLPPPHHHHHSHFCLSLVYREFKECGLGAGSLSLQDTHKHTPCFQTRSMLSGFNVDNMKRTPPALRHGENEGGMKAGKRERERVLENIS